MPPPTPRSRHRPARSAAQRTTPAGALPSCAPAAASAVQAAGAALQAVPSTLLIPLAARARGDRYFPQWACGDSVAASLLERLGTDVQPYLDDLPTVLNEQGEDGSGSRRGSRPVARLVAGWRT